MIKVLLTGSTTTGKSTLIRELQSQPLPGVVYIEELARQFLQDNPGVERDPRLQDYLFDHQVAAEQAAAKAGTNILICDRGIPDNIAHAHLYGQPIKKLWLDWSKSYDLVFLTHLKDVPFSQPTELQLHIDPNRDWVAFRNDLHRYIVQALAECTLSPITLEGSVPTRLESIQSRLQPWLTTGPEGNPRRRQERL